MYTKGDYIEVWAHPIVDNLAKGYFWKYIEFGIQVKNVMKVSITKKNTIISVDITKEDLSIKDCKINNFKTIDKKGRLIKIFEFEKDEKIAWSSVGVMYE